MSWWHEQRKAWAHDWGEVGNGSRRIVELAKQLFGHLTRLVVYGALFLVLYAYWPETNIFEMPLGSLTLREIGLTVFGIAAALFLVRALFNPSENESIRTAWQSLGVLILIGIAAAALIQ